MQIVVTGSAGHLGEALMSTFTEAGHEVVGIDVLPSPTTEMLGSITDRSFVRAALRDADAVVHAATLHKPHVRSHPRQAFVDVNVTGTLVLLEESVTAGVGRFVFTSTTSAFGRALTPAPDAPAVWVAEDLHPLPRNIYGATKVAAEDLCELVRRDHGLPCVILRTARFFPEPDDTAAVRDRYSTANAQLNELLYRRVDIADVARAHLLAVERADAVGFGRFIVNATTPFTRADLSDLRRDAASVVGKHFPGFEKVYADLGWRMFPVIDRVYDNARARAALGWAPRYDFASGLERVAAGLDPRSALAARIGEKGYHRS
ncbi:NAD-dependent epimerase/dehydratase family protein [Nakamurella sp. GG22]